MRLIRGIYHTTTKFHHNNPNYRVYSHSAASLEHKISQIYTIKFWPRICSTLLGTTVRDDVRGSVHSEGVQLR